MLGECDFTKMLQLKENEYTEAVKKYTKHFMV